MDGGTKIKPKLHLEAAREYFRGISFCTKCREKTPHDISKSRFGYQATCHQCGKGGRAKFNNGKSEYNGRWYDSGAEAIYAAELDIRVKAGEIKSWEPQKRFEFEINGRAITTHKVDFQIINHDGSIELHEVKGVVTEDYRIRRNLLLALIVDPDPNITYQVIKA